MSLQEIEAIITHFASVQAGWDENTQLEKMRTDLDEFYASYSASIESDIETLSINGIPAELIVTTGVSRDKILLYLHGGGFMMGSRRSHRPIAEYLSRESSTQVLLIDYRLAPEHVFPAALEDAVTSYCWLLDQGYGAHNIAIAGDSAGAGLTVALLAELSKKNIDLPACAALLSPWADMECRGNSYETQAALDPIASREMALQMAAQYLGETGKADDPRASSIYAKFEGFPPLFIHAGEREVFLDDARTIARQAEAAGVDVRFKEWPGMIHAWHLFASQLQEGREAIEKTGRFIKEQVSNRD